MFVWLCLLLRSNDGTAFVGVRNIKFEARSLEDRDSWIKVRTRSVSLALCLGLVSLCYQSVSLFRFFRLV